MTRQQFVALLLASGSPALAAEIILPSTALERDHAIPAVYRTNARATGKGNLSIRWTDVHGRVVEDRKIPVEYVVYPREGHGIAEPAHQRDLMERNLRWFTLWLK